MSIVSLSKPFRRLKHLFRGALALLLAFWSFTSSSQSFNNVTSENFIDVLNIDGNYGNGVSFADFDQDGWDDLSFGTQNGNPVFYKNEGGSFYEFPLEIELENSSAIKSIQWIDFDNDGDMDLFMTREYNSVLLFENTGELYMVDITEEAGIALQLVKNYGSSWGDYDKDGDLDLYICKYHTMTINQGYEHRNHLYRNNGNGTFSDVTNEAGVGDGIKASFQSIFFDYNNDGWEDIYVINDRLSYANTLFHNNGDGTFDDVSEASGANVVMDAMTISVADFDRDEDFDIYISDTSVNKLLRNNGDGTFTDVAEEQELQVFQWSWSALWMDFDNNTFEDLHVACINNFPNSDCQNHFYSNSGGFFECMHNSIGLENDDFATYSTALGDINNDGYPDFVENNQDGVLCQLWQNTGGQNNWLKIDLHGVLSNANGAGCVVKCYTNEIVQCRYVHLGEAYLSQSSSREMIGLNNIETVDSLHVLWPSGILDKFYNVEVNQTLNITEGNTFSTQIVSNSQNEICPGDSVLLSVSNGDSFIWSNGENSQSQWVSEAGDYFAEVIIDSITVTTDTVTISYLPPPAVQATIEDVTCHGGNDGSILLSNQNGFGVNQVIWEVGINGEFIDSLTSQNYQYTLFDNNSCKIQGLVTVDEPAPLDLELEVEVQNESSNGSALIDISGGVPPYSIYWSVGDSNSIFIDDLPPGEYNVEVVDDNGCSESLSFTIDEYIGVDEWFKSEGITVYPNPFQTHLTIKSEVRLRSLELTTITGVVVWEQSYQIGQKQKKEFLRSIQLASGVYYLTVNTYRGIQQFEVIKN